MKRITVFATLLAALWSIPGPAQKSSRAEVLLESARQKETLEGDLKGAIREYEEIVKRYSSDRAVAAKALIGMAECHRKLGNAEAQKIYERLLREYADQREPADAARMGLASLRPLPVSSSGIVNKKVWTLPDRGDIYGAVSPDGRYIPYVAWAENGDLFLHDLVTGADRRLTNTATDRPGTPKSEEQYAEEYAFSRDGKQLVYSWFGGDRDRYELRIVNLRGSGVPPFRKLFANEDVDWIGPHDWSPDGKWIAVQLQRKDKSAQIGLVSAQDGSLRVLKSVDWRGASGVFFSLDSKYLAYDLPATETSQQRDAFLLAVDGSREIPAVVHPSHDAVLGWSPDGKRLLFASDRSGSMSLWALRFSDGKTEGPPELLKRDIGQIDNMGVTASGTLYYWSHTGMGADIQIATFDFEKGSLLSPPVQAVQTYVGSNQSPDWSHDGKALAYFSRRGSVGSRYFVIGIRSVETGAIREIMPSPNFGLFWSLTWSHDDNSFLVGGRDVKGRNGIFRIEAQTGRTSIIVEGVRAAWAAVESADGKMLYYPAQVSDGQEVAYIRRDLASDEETVLFQRANLGRSASLSPDGLYLAVHEVARPRVPVAVLLVPTAGGPPRELMRVSEPQNTVFLAWTPDGRSVLTRKFLGPGQVEQWRIPLDGGQPNKLEVNARFPSAGFRVHPDGRQVVFPVATPRMPSEVWVLENFLPTLTTSK